MKRSIALVLTICLLVGVFAGCAGGSGAADGFKGRTLEVLYMVGGQKEMCGPVIDKLKSLYPELTITMQYDHNAHEIMRNKVMSGTPPDIFDLNGGFYDYYGAIAEGVCKDLKPILDTKTVDGTATLRDVLDMNALAKGCVDGKNYLIPDAIYTSGIWYNAKLLKDSGVNPPTSWDEFMAACEKFKGMGVAGMAYPGPQAAEYFNDYFLIPMINALDHQAFLDLQNLKPNAWSNPAVMEALTRVQTMVEKGYIDSNSPGYQAAEVQMEFIKNKIAFYSCGSWLEAEMGDNWPADFELTYLPWSGGTSSSDTKYTLQANVVSAVAAKTKNLDIVQEWYKYLLSDKETTKKVVEIHTNGLPLKTFSADFGSLLPKSVQGSWDALANGNQAMISMLGNWYPESWNMIGDCINSMISGDLDAKGFADRMNAQDAKIVADGSVTKYAF